jgi:hypothetical protein
VPEMYLLARGIEVLDLHSRGRRLSGGQHC